MFPALEPSDKLWNLIYFALDYGIDSVRRSGNTLITFLVVDSQERRSLIRFVAEDNETSVEQARQAAQALNPDSAYAIAFDAYLNVNGERTDTILVEAAEGEAAPLRVGQCYRPGAGRRAFELLGNPVWLGHPRRDRRDADL